VAPQWHHFSKQCLPTHKHVTPSPGTQYKKYCDYAPTLHFSNLAPDAVLQRFLMPSPQAASERLWLMRLGMAHWRSFLPAAEPGTKGAAGLQLLLMLLILQMWHLALVLICIIWPAADGCWILQVPRLRRGMHKPSKRQAVLPACPPTLPALPALILLA
jgi:hypothetical protein